MKLKKSDIIEEISIAKAFQTTGMIYQYGYNPKYKDVLPFYDKLPAMILLKRTSRHLLGLNIHFLSKRRRAQLANQVIKLNKNKTEMSLTYRQIKPFLIKNNMTVAIRKYIIGRITTPKIKTPKGVSVYTNALVHLNTKKIYGLSEDKIYNYLVKTAAGKKRKPYKTKKIKKNRVK